MSDKFDKLAEDLGEVKDKLGKISSALGSIKGFGGKLWWIGFLFTIGAMATQDALIDTTTWEKFLFGIVTYFIWPLFLGLICFG